MLKDNTEYAELLFIALLVQRWTNSQVLINSDSTGLVVYIDHENVTLNKTNFLNFNPVWNEQ